MATRLGKAIAAFEDENSKDTIADRLGGLRDALMWEGFDFLKKTDSQKGIKEDDEARYLQCMKYFKEMEKMYQSKVKMDKLAGKKATETDKEFLSYIKEMKDTVGDVIQDSK